MYHDMKKILFALELSLNNSRQYQKKDLHEYQLEAYKIVALQILPDEEAVQQLIDSRRKSFDEYIGT